MTSSPSTQDDSHQGPPRQLADILKYLADEKYHAAPNVRDTNGDISSNCIQYYYEMVERRDNLFEELTKAKAYNVEDYMDLLRACGTKDTPYAKNRVKVINLILSHFPEPMRTDAYNLLIDAIDDLTKSSEASSVGKQIVQRMADNVELLKDTADICLHDVWIHCFVLMSSCEHSSGSGSDNDAIDDDEESGQNRRSKSRTCRSMIEELLRGVKWEKNMGACIKIFQEDFDITETEFRGVIRRVMGRMRRKLEANAITSLTYPVLILAQRGIPEYILRELFSLLDETQIKLVEAGNYTENAHLESEVLASALSAFSRDQELFKSFLRMVKNRELPLSSLVVSIAVAMIQYDFSVTRDIATLLDEEYATSRKIAQGDTSADSHMESSVATLSGTLISITQQLATTNTPIGQPLLELAFSLLLKKPAKKSSKYSTGATAHSGMHCSDVGEKIITTLFREVADSKATIVKTLFKKVLVSSENMASVYAELLLSLLKFDATETSFPDSANSLLATIEINMDYILLHPPNIARMLIEAMIAVIDQNRAESLMNRLMMFFRKSIYDKDKDVREIATSGFLNILKNHSFASQNPEEMHNGEEERKILGLLQRCLAQSLDMRRLVYRELFDVLVARRELEGIILKLLHGNFVQYILHDDAADVPLDLEQCVSDDHGLIEPLADLLFVMQRAVACQKHDNDDSNSVRDTVSRFCTKLKSCSASALDMEGEDLTFDNVTDEGKISRARAELMLSLYQVAMQYVLMSNILPPRSAANEDDDTSPISDNVSADIAKLFRNYQDVLKFAAKHSTVKGEVKGNKKFSDANINMISSDALLRFFEVFHQAYDESNHNGDEENLTSLDFLGFLLKLYRKKLKLLDPKTDFEDITGICRWIMQVLVLGGKHLEKHRITMGACLWDSFERMSQTGNNALLLKFCVRMLLGKEHEDNYDSDSERLEFIIEGLYRINFSGDDDHAAVRNASLFKIISALSSYLTQEQKKRHLDLMLEVCKLDGSNNFKSELISNILSHVSLLCSTLEEFHTLECLSKEIYHNMTSGTVTKDYGIIDPETAGKHCSEGIVKVLPDVIHNLEWKFNELESTTKLEWKKYKSDNKGQKNRKDSLSDFTTSPKVYRARKELYSQLLKVVKISYHLTNAHPREKDKDSSKKQVEPLSLIKVLERLYKFIGHIAKYELDFGSSEKIDRFKSLAVKCNELGTSANPLIQFTCTYPKNKTKHRLKKETKQLSALVYVREKYDHFLIQLSTKSNVNLMEKAEKFLIPEMEIKKRKRSSSSPGKKKGTQSRAKKGK
eukprot:CAMPEP_0117453852 /NCGR_PEP_ID=MMETSP0759-20121206/10461_1 /TAXON_ID=63605 /ORGANISM="Percolomonas cosmopolitus, Strain WS" /LENGTH=1295 /DNA_ID=CAMNT_0005246945 /DNA_START=118 /DNA_END=4005 /DNA_ORIENTATION=-